MEMTPDIILTAVLAAASAIVLLSNAAEKIVKAVKAWKAPNAKQDARLKDLEEWKKTVESKLNKDNERLEKMEDANSATIRALLAWLNHGIDGNNIKQMQDAKELLQDYLINR